MEGRAGVGAVQELCVRQSGSRLLLAGGGEGHGAMVQVRVELQGGQEGSGSGCLFV